MHASDETAPAVVEHLQLTAARLHDLIDYLETAPDCDRAIGELATISTALTQAGFWLLAAQLRQCLTTTASSDERGRHLARLERLFLSLA